MSRRKDNTRGENVGAFDQLLDELQYAAQRLSSREGIEKFRNAHEKIFELAESSLQLNRDPFDFDCIRALGLRLLGED